MGRYYIDCEFDGHNGALLSIAAICDDRGSIHIRAQNKASDPWVRANVMPHMDSHEATTLAFVSDAEVGGQLRWFMRGDDAPTIVADSPVDIARFAKAVSTGDDGGYFPCFAPRMTFEVHDVDAYPTDIPGAVQHNAWWDALALQHKLSPTP